MNKKPMEVSNTEVRAWVTRQRRLGNGKIVKSVIPIHVRPTPPAEWRRRRELALEWERCRVLEMK